MPSKRKIKQRKRAELRAADLARCEALIFAEKEAEAVVVTEELVVGAGLPKTETTSPEYLLRKMIVEKISDAEVVVASMKSSIEEKEQLIADNRATLAGSQEETLNLQKQLAILDNISGVTPLDLAPRPVIDSRLATPFVDSKTRGWTKVLDHTLQGPPPSPYPTICFAFRLVWRDRRRVDYLETDATRLTIACTITRIWTTQKI
jgi:hypothetical protein